MPIVRVLSFRDFSSVNCTIWRYHKYLKVVKSFKKLHCSLCCIKTRIIYERCLEYKIEIVLLGVSVSSKQCQRALSLTVPLFWSSILAADFNIKLSCFTLGGNAVPFSCHSFYKQCQLNVTLSLLLLTDQCIVSKINALVRYFGYYGTLDWLKVMLCSYLILKQMNKRITDNWYINKYTYWTYKGRIYPFVHFWK